MMSTITFH